MPRTTLQIDLSTLGLSAGAHEITAIARAPGYAPSAPSEAVTYNVYAITYSLTHAAGDNPAVIGDGASATLTFSAESGYELPASITVSGATLVSWNAQSGEAVISNPTGAVTVTVEALVPWSAPTITLDGDTISTPIVDGVTKYKVYDDGTYIGYIDSDNVWHGEVSE